MEKLWLIKQLFVKERKKWKEIFDNPQYEPTREEKIGQFKEKKALETKIKVARALRVLFSDKLMIRNLRQ
mgnify:FL=1